MASADEKTSLQLKRRTLYNQRSRLDFNAVGLYGPKATLIKNVAKNSTFGSSIEDPSCDYHLDWKDKPDCILLMKKFRDSTVTSKFKEVARWLIETHKVTVFCEPDILTEPQIKEDEFSDINDQLVTWDDESKDEALLGVDMVICIGGDGTLLYTSSMFQDRMPPIMSFHMGSLGFLTPFQLENYQTDITKVLTGCPSITLRHRLICEIRSSKTVSLPTAGANTAEDDVCKIEPETNSPNEPKARMLMKFPTKLLLPTEDLKTKMLVMNELVVDRGPSPYLTNLELFCNGRSMTSVQGDGIIIATPTGSTAYSLAAGSSMVHPSVPCMLVTPICPHSLSFRSIVVPAGVEITIRVASESRNTAWVAFDGRNRQELMQGDSVVVVTSPSPVPSVNNTGHVTDWFDSLAECLQWNVRKQQKSLN